MLDSLLRALLRAFRGSPCDVCGKIGAKLTVTATKAGTRIDGNTGERVRTYVVDDCRWLCQECRGKQ